MTQFNNLRDANQARQIEWDTAGDITLSYAGNEFAGEVGELIQAVMDYLNGSNNIIAVREEIGDVIICCDLLAGRVDRKLLFTDAEFTNHTTPTDALIKERLIDLAIEAGNVCNTVKKQERERFGMVGAKGSLDDMIRNLDEIVMIVTLIAADLNIVAKQCVADKFNLTSRKYGLKTEMMV